MDNQSNNTSNLNRILILIVFFSFLVIMFLMLVPVQLEEPLRSIVINLMSEIIALAIITLILKLGIENSLDTKVRDLQNKTSSILEQNNALQQSLQELIHQINNLNIQNLHADDKTKKVVIMNNPKLLETLKFLFENETLNVMDLHLFENIISAEDYKNLERYIQSKSETDFNHR